MEHLRDRFVIQDVEAALQEAIALARSGEKAQARELLDRIVQAEPHHEAAWRWLAWCATSRAERLHALRQVVAINPANTRARQLLASMEEPPWQALWEMRHNRYVHAFVVGVVVLLVLGLTLSVAIPAYREARRRNLEAAVRTSEARKIEAVQTATARSWIIPTWTPAPTPTRLPSPTNTLVVPRQSGIGSGAAVNWPTPSPGCCP